MTADKILHFLWQFLHKNFHLKEMDSMGLGGNFFNTSSDKINTIC